MKGILARMRAAGVDGEAMEAALELAAACAVSRVGNVKCMRVLAKAGFDWTKAEGVEVPAGLGCEGGCCPLLHMACRTGDAEMVTYLLDKGCDPRECGS